jgi:thioredoxin reductase (NADPH)
MLSEEGSCSHGCEHSDDGTVRVDENGRTSTPGVLAAGDMTTLARQVTVAAATGARAAITIQHDLLAEDFV